MKSRLFNIRLSFEITENKFGFIFVPSEDLKKFNVLEKVIKSRLIIYTINELLGTTNGIEKIHIEDVIKLCKNNIGNKYLTPNKNIKIMIKNKKIFFTRYCKLP